MNDHIVIMYVGRILLSIKTMLTKPVGVAMLVPIVASPVFTTVQKSLILLGGLFVADFITGIIASYLEFKRSLPVLPASGKRYVIQSSKLRMSVVKFVFYGLSILTAYGIEIVFVSKEFELHADVKKMSLTTIMIAFCCGIEAYSIFFENIKRMGFDIIEKVKNIFKSGYSVYDTIKNENKE